jgi:hypothetical protein
MCGNRGSLSAAFSKSAINHALILFTGSTANTDFYQALSLLVKGKEKYGRPMVNRNETRRLGLLHTTTSSPRFDSSHPTRTTAWMKWIDNWIILSLKGTDYRCENYACRVFASTNFQTKCNTSVPWCNNCLTFLVSAWTGGLFLNSIFHRPTGLSTVDFMIVLY